MSENESKFNPEPRENYESSVRELVDLASKTGFEISPETQRCLDEVNAENIGEAISAWRPHAELFASQAEGEYWHPRQMGLLILEAAIILKAGLAEDFFEAAESVEDYAFGARLNGTLEDFKTIIKTINR
jgi:hypothetical protein